jgi:hypothetical protein
VSAYKGTGGFYTFTNPDLVLNKNEYRIAYEYTGDNFGALIQFRFDDIVKALITTAENNKKPIADLFSAVIGDVKLTGKLNDAISVELGNTAKRGIFGDYRYASFFGDGKTPKFDGFGIQKSFSYNFHHSDPLYAGFNRIYSVDNKSADIEVNNLDRNAAGLAGIGALLNVNVGPATISLASQFRTSEYKPLEAAALAPSRGNLGVRVELPKLADLVNLAVVYKVNFADDTKDGYLADTAGVNKGDVDGNAVADHAFGIYGNLSPIEGLGVSLGYSGAFSWQENTKTKTDTIDGTGVLYSGIDLRVAYTAIDKTKIWFNNNFSFASAKGEGDGVGYPGSNDKTANLGIFNAQLIKDESESYIILTNTLGGTYALTEKLTLKAQLGNTLKSGTHENSASGASLKKVEIIEDTFGFYAGAAYAPNSNVSVHAGLSLVNTAHSLKVTFDTTPPDWKNAEDGTFVFAIPVGVKVTF